MRLLILQLAAAVLIAATAAAHVALVRAAAEDEGLGIAAMLERRALTDSIHRAVDKVVEHFQPEFKPDANELEKLPLLGGYPDRSAPLDVVPVRGRNVITKDHDDVQVAVPSEREDESLMWHDEGYKSWKLDKKFQWPREWDARRRELQVLRQTAESHTAHLDEWLPRGFLGIRYPNPGAPLKAQEASKRAEEILRLGKGKEGYRLRRIGSSGDSLVGHVSKEYVTRLLKDGELLLWEPPRLSEAPR